VAELRIEDATIRVEDTALADHRGRAVFEWTVTLDSGESWSSADLKGPVIGPEPSEREMLGTLLAFLSACAESGEDGEHADLFPPGLREWAEHNADEIAVEQCVLDG